MMPRKVELRIREDTVQRIGTKAGVKGEGNVTDLVCSFDESWDGLAKTLTFWNAELADPVKIVLTTNLLVQGDTRKYMVKIPAEPLKLTGSCTVTVDGTKNGVRARTVGVELEVEDSPMTDSAGTPVDPTPTQAQQLQQQIEAIKGDVVRAGQAADAKDAAEKSAETAKAAAERAEDAAGVVENAAQNIDETVNKAVAEAEKQIDDKVEVSALHLSAKVADAKQEIAEAAETEKQGLRTYAAGVKTGIDQSAEEAQAAKNAVQNMTVSGEHRPAGEAVPAVEKQVNEKGEVNLHFLLSTGVYVGSGDMPEDCNVQIDPLGDVLTPEDLKGKNGYTPVRGKDYWTDADIAEIKGYVDEAILGGKW